MLVKLLDRTLRYSKWFIMVMVLILAGYFFYSHRDSVWQRMQPFVTKNDESLTELYFTDYESMPKRLSVNTQYAVGFTIANHEGEKKVYKYQATITENLDSRELPPQSVEIDDGRSAQLQILFTPLQLFVREKVTINLLDMGQSIQYRAST